MPNAKNESPVPGKIINELIIPASEYPAVEVKGWIVRRPGWAETLDWRTLAGRLAFGIESIFLSLR